MVDPLAGWHDEHAKFAQLLDILKAQVDAFHRGEHPNYDLMSDAYFGECDRSFRSIVTARFGRS